MACRSKNSNRFVAGDRVDLCDVTRRAVDADRREATQMLDLALAAETDRPAKFWVWNQTKVPEVRRGKQIGINFDARAQYPFRHHFGAPRSMQKKIQIFRRPFGALR